MCPALLHPSFGISPYPPPPKKKMPFSGNTFFQDPIISGIHKRCDHLKSSFTSLGNMMFYPDFRGPYVITFHFLIDFSDITVYG